MSARRHAEKKVSISNFSPIECGKFPLWWWSCSPERWLNSFVNFICESRWNQCKWNASVHTTWFEWKINWKAFSEVKCNTFKSTLYWIIYTKKNEIEFLEFLIQRLRLQLKRFTFIFWKIYIEVACMVIAFNSMQFQVFLISQNVFKF